MTLTFYVTVDGRNYDDCRQRADAIVLEFFGVKPVCTRFDARPSVIMINGVVRSFVADAEYQLEGLA